MVQCTKLKEKLGNFLRVHWPDGENITSFFFNLKQDER